MSLVPYSSKVEGTGISETHLSTLQYLPSDTNSAITVLSGHVTTDSHLYIQDFFFFWRDSPPPHLPYPPVDQGLFIYEAFRSQTTTHHSR